jgi:hypothetical protein
MWTVVGIGVAMLMEDFFDAVTRAFTKKVDRISLPSRPDPKNPLELLLPTAERTRATHRRIGVVCLSGGVCQIVVYHRDNLLGFPSDLRCERPPKILLTMKYASFRKT